MEIVKSNYLQLARQAYLPILPHVLQDVTQVLWIQHEKIQHNQQIKHLFPHTFDQPLLRGEKREKRHTKPLRIGVVLSGGQAPGGHNVITGVFDALQALNNDSHLLGFIGGPEGIIKGKYKELHADFLAPYRNQGGFDMIGTGRTKIETEEQLAASLAVVNKLQLDGLIIIGGDDSNTNAAILAEYFLKHHSKTKVIGVPKTIDGDLKNPYVATPFGFDTACKTYSEMIGNIARDALSAKKYYHFIKLMGRSASHIALECALATHPNLTLIGEEVAAKELTLAQVTTLIADLICQRAEAGKHYGVILIPEGLIEFIPEINTTITELNHLIVQDPSAKDISSKLSPSSHKCFNALPERIRQQLLLSRDPHGNVQVSLIETERLLIETVTKELEARKKNTFAAVQHFLGYEGRAGFPSNFDCNYCYALGQTAVLLVDEGVTGYMAFISDLTKPPEEWGIGGVPLASLIHLEKRKGKEKPVIQKALVDLTGRPFAYYELQRERWRSEDDYAYPGPLQFFGDPVLTDSIPLTLHLEHI